MRGGAVLLAGAAVLVIVLSARRETKAPGVRAAAPALRVDPVPTPGGPPRVQAPAALPPAPAPADAAPAPEDEDRRAAHCVQLGEDPAPEAKWELLARMIAEAPRVRRAAALALASRNLDPDVRAALEHRIRIDPVKDVRVAAARALGR